MTLPSHNWTVGNADTLAMGMMTQFPNPKMKPREQVAAKLISLDQDHFGFCPTCGMPIIEKAPLQQGKLVCSNCDAKFVRIDHEGQRFLVKVDSRLQKCPCGEGEVIVKANSKTGAPFAGCSRYPACKFTADHRNYINSIKPYFNPFQRNMPLPSPTTTNATVDEVFNTGEPTMPVPVPATTPTTQRLSCIEAEDKIVEFIEGLTADHVDTYIEKLSKQEAKELLIEMHKAGMPRPPYSDNTRYPGIKRLRSKHERAIRVPTIDIDYTLKHMEIDREQPNNEPWMGRFSLNEGYIVYQGTKQPELIKLPEPPATPPNEPPQIYDPTKSFTQEKIRLYNTPTGQPIPDNNSYKVLKHVVTPPNPDTPKRTITIITKEEEPLPTTSKKTFEEPAEDAYDPIFANAIQTKHPNWFSKTTTETQPETQPTAAATPPRPSPTTDPINKAVQDVIQAISNRETAAAAREASVAAREASVAAREHAADIKDAQQAQAIQQAVQQAKELARKELIEELSAKL